MHEAGVPEVASPAQQARAWLQSSYRAWAIDQYRWDWLAHVFAQSRS
jgi:hypothetical protein